jgi:hypothetical protein
VYPHTLVKNRDMIECEEFPLYVTILYNDDVHTFDEVIDALLKVSFSFFTLFIVIVIVIVIVTILI